MVAILSRATLLASMRSWRFRCWRALVFSSSLNLDRMKILSLGVTVLPSCCSSLIQLFSFSLILEFTVLIACSSSVMGLV